MQLTMPIEIRRRRPEGRWQARRGGSLIAAGATGAMLAYFLDPERGRRRRHTARDRTLALGRRSARNAARRAEHAVGPVRGAAHRAEQAVHPSPPRDYDEVTLARKVETEIFRPADAPKGSVNVNVHEHVVELRGTVERPDQIAALGEAAAAVDGVERVENLLHTPDQPAPHAPPSDPADVRARAAAHHGNGAKT
ncbi:BON domain-containing protein [Conexibacter arvalis]|uniref:BON domain-containing protein n=1 Tax=Conexibacter arvalis TaxID=912552 RepID=A0A840IHV6_9ACTN|nr:BON domain-containing protein [Conexibacter arvalis]MBB4663753.1 hypothetical protein [Conexibacter arvalis]